MLGEGPCSRAFADPGLEVPLTADASGLPGRPGTQEQGGGGPAWRCLWRGRGGACAPMEERASCGGAPGRRVWTVAPEKPRSRALAGASVAAPLVAGRQVGAVEGVEARSAPHPAGPPLHRI